MKFKIRRATGSTIDHPKVDDFEMGYYGADYTVKFNSITELMKFINDVKCEIIVYPDKSITIYDDYIEE